MESWERDLQKHLLQKAVNCEMGQDTPIEDMIQKARGFPEGYRQLWGKTWYVKHNGKMVREATLTKQEDTEQDKKIAGETVKRFTDVNTGDWGPSREGVRISKLYTSGRISAKEYIKQITKMDEEYEKLPKIKEEPKKETPTKFTFAGFVQINPERDQQIVVKDKEGNFHRKLLDKEDNDKLRAGIMPKEKEALVEKYFGKEMDESKGKYMYGRPENTPVRNLNTGKEIK